MVGSCQWLSDACEVTTPPKGEWTTKDEALHKPKPRIHFQRLLKLQGALSEIVNSGFNPNRQSALERKVNALRWRAWTRMRDRREDLLASVYEEVQRYLECKRKMAIDRWKHVARDWKVSAAKVF